MGIFSSKPYQFEGKHVMVTGGSSGIGRAVAAEVAKRGANVSLLARNQARLEEAQSYVKTKCNDNQKVVCVASDVSGDYPSLEQAIKKAQEELGPVDVLVNSAGISVSHRFDETPIEEMKRVMDVNYLGSVQATRAVIGQMKERQEGRVLFVSSLAGVVGVYGYTGYCASKFAVRGLAEALFMEVKPYGVKVIVTYPPDVNTPMLAEESKTRPEETTLIAGTVDLKEPEEVATSIVDDIQKGNFISSQGTDGWMLTTAAAGFSPASSISQAFGQFLAMGPLRLVALMYVRSFDKIVSKCKQEKEAAKKKE